MSYIVKSSEKTRGKGAEGETKALLYLMNFREDSDEVYYFVIDFFNDVTGLDKHANKLWDVQSKYTENNSPKQIGAELVTLFKNYISDIKFYTYILFIKSVSSTFRIDNNKNSFDINNIQRVAYLKMRQGFIEECKKKTYIDESKFTESDIDEFLKQVVFVVDDKLPQDYIKPIIEGHVSILPDNEKLVAIFEEIRNTQSNKKNSNVEDTIIETPDEALLKGRHISKQEIVRLVFCRIINWNPFKKGIPKPFEIIYSQWPSVDKDDYLDECRTNLCKALFNSNATDLFWSIFDEIYNLVLQHPDYDINKLYSLLDRELVNKSTDLDLLSMKFFIAVIKEGIVG